MISTLQRVSNNFFKSDFIRSAALIAIGTAVGQGIIALSTPLLTRIYRPEDVGVLTTYHAIISLLSVVNSLRYEIAIPMVEDDDDAANVLALCLLIVLAISLLAGLGCWLFADQIVNWSQVPELKAYLWLIPVGSVVSGVYQVLRFWGVRKKLFSPIAQSQLGQGVGMVVAQVGFGLMRLGLFGMLFGYISGYIFSGAMLGGVIWRNQPAIFAKTSFSKIREMADRYRRFPLYSASATFINRVTATIPYLLLLPLFGPQVTGWFGLGYRVILTPTYVVGLAVSQVYLNAAANMARENPSALKQFFQKIALRLFLVSIIPAVILFLFGSVLFGRIFGENWREAGVYVQILAPVILVQFVFTPLLQTVSVIERQDIQLIWDTSTLVILLVIFAVAWLAHLDARTTVVAYSAGMIVSYLWLFWLYSRGLNQFVRQSTMVPQMSEP